MEVVYSMLRPPASVHALAPSTVGQCYVGLRRVREPDKYLLLCRVRKSYAAVLAFQREAAVGGHGKGA